LRRPSVKKHVTSLLLLTFLGALFAFAARVTTDYNHSADLSQYHTYSWIKVKADPLWIDRITQAVDRELASKGWTKVETGGDTGITAFQTTRERPTIQTFYDTFGGGWFWRGFGDGVATTTVEETPVGTLVVDIFDNHTKKLVWRGVATETLTGKPEKDEKKLDKAVEDMFKHFPPRPRG
jgi:hypothetical protein